MLARFGGPVGSIRRLAELHGAGHESEALRCVVAELCDIAVRQGLRIIRDFERVLRDFPDGVESSEQLPPMRDRSGREVVFEQALTESPRNGWVLWGLAEAQRATGDAGLAETEAALAAAWLGDEALLSLDRL